MAHAPRLLTKHRYNRRASEIEREASSAKSADSLDATCSLEAHVMLNGNIMTAGHAVSVAPVRPIRVSCGPLFLEASIAARMTTRSEAAPDLVAVAGVAQMRPHTSVCRYRYERGGIWMVALEMH